MPENDPNAEHGFLAQPERGSRTRALIWGVVAVDAVMLLAGWLALKHFGVL